MDRTILRWAIKQQNISERACKTMKIFQKTKTPPVWDTVVCVILLQQRKGSVSISQSRFCKPIELSEISSEDSWRKKEGRGWMRGDRTGDGRESEAVRRSLSQGRSNTAEMPLLPTLVFKPSLGSELHCQSCHSSVRQFRCSQKLLSHKTHFFLDRKWKRERGHCLQLQTKTKAVWVFV